MELDDGTYISFWPGSSRNYSKVSDGIYTAEEIPNQTHADVLRLEGQPPDHTIHISNIDTASVKQWWGDWQNNQWATLRYNCSTTVYHALRAGGKPYSFQFIWKPGDVRDYAYKIKDR